MLPEGFATPRLTLRPIACGDAPAIFAGYAQDPEIVRYLSWRPHRALAETEGYIARCLAAPADQSRTYALTGRAGFPCIHGDRGDQSRTYALTGRAECRLLGAFELRLPAPHRLDCRMCWPDPTGGAG